MSVHTFATIGYGSISPIPEKFYMNLWVTVESALGIIASTIFTGIAWSKFARPRAHIHFSSKVLFANFYGHRCLMLRAANTRHSGDVHENFFRIGVILNNRKTGLRQLYDVPLVQAEFPSIKLPATLVHIIDESSPFYKLDSLEALSASRVAVIALLTGLDTTFSENVYGRKMYFWEDFAFDMRFQDFALLKRDSVVVDFNKFDALIPDPSMPFAPV
jgi:inward rectifier potassium channel